RVQAHRVFTRAEIGHAPDQKAPVFQRLEIDRYGIAVGGEDLDVRDLDRAFTVFGVKGEGGLAARDAFSSLAPRGDGAIGDQRAGLPAVGVTAVVGTAALKESYAEQHEQRERPTHEWDYAQSSTFRPVQYRTFHGAEAVKDVRF